MAAGYSDDAMDIGETGPAMSLSRSNVSFSKNVLESDNGWELPGDVDGRPAPNSWPGPYVRKRKADTEPEDYQKKRMTNNAREKASNVQLVDDGHVASGSGDGFTFRPIVLNQIETMAELAPAAVPAATDDDKMALAEADYWEEKQQNDGEAMYCFAEPEKEPEEYNWKDYKQSKEYLRDPARSSPRQVPGQLGFIPAEMVGTGKREQNMSMENKFLFVK